MKMIPSSPLSTLHTRLRALQQANDGVATIELALVTPFVCLLLLGVVDIAQATAMRLDLVQAAQRATELALVKHPTTNTDWDYLRNEAIKAVEPLATEVTVDLYGMCNGTRQTYTQTACTSPISRFVSVQVEATYSPIFNYGPFVKMLGGTSNGLSAMTLTGSSLVRIQ